jgi:hypothetical protein
VTPPAQVISGSGDSAAGTGPALGPFDPLSVDFTQFALVTGGRVLFARNDVDQEIAEEIGEGNSYYTISYVPQSQSDVATAYRQIHVTMKDPTLQAVTRGGYFPAPLPVDKVEKSGAVKQSKQLSFDLMTAAQSNLVYNGLSVIATRSSSGFEIKVGTEGMKWVPQENGDRLAEVTVLGVAYSAKGKPLNQRAAQLTERIGPDAVVGRNTRVTVSFAFSTPPGTARVRLVIRDAGTGAIGTGDPKP